MDPDRLADLGTDSAITRRVGLPHSRALRIRTAGERCPLRAGSKQPRTARCRRLDPQDLTIPPSRSVWIPVSAPDQSERCGGEPQGRARRPRRRRDYARRHQGARLL